VPTYSYACTECGDRFDAVQTFADDALTTCTKCSGKLRKLFNSVGVVFKGSGFYRNDSRDAAAKAKSSASGSTSGGSDSPASTGDKSAASSSEKSSGTSSSEKSSSTPASSTPAPAAASSN
jgi:putative FmdB family regulatory protein